MKVQFLCVYNGEIFEHLGLESITTYLTKHGHDASIIVINTTTNVYDAIKLIDMDTDFIGISIAYTTAEYIYQLCEILKKNKMKNISIFAGGPFASLCAELILRDCLYIDFIVLGDGEVIVKKIMDYYKIYKCIPKMEAIYRRGDNLCEKKAYKISSQDFIPIEHSMLKLKEFKSEYRARIYGSRGCCGHCSFCTHNYNSITTRKWQGKDIESLFHEIIDIYESTGIRIFSFNDSSFEDPGILGKKRINELCDMLLNYPIRFSFNIYCRTETFSIEDLALIQKMRKAGFLFVFLGIESMDNNDLLIYNKLAKSEDNEKANSIFTENGFYVIHGFININPYTTFESLRSNYDFLIKNRCYLSSVYLSKLSVYYGSDIYFRLLKDNLLKDSYTYLNIHRYLFVNPEIAKLSEKIDEINLKSKYYNIENDFMNFEQLLFHIENLYNLNSEEERNQIEDIKTKIIKEKIIFFEKLFFNFWSIVK